MKRYSKYSEKEMIDFFIKSEEVLSPFEVTETQSQKELKVQLEATQNENKQFARQIKDQSREIEILDKHRGDLYQDIQALLKRVADLEKKP